MDTFVKTCGQPKEFNRSLMLTCDYCKHKSFGKPILGDIFTENINFPNKINLENVRKKNENIQKSVINQRFNSFVYTLSSLKKVISLLTHLPWDLNSKKCEKCKKKAFHEDHICKDVQKFEASRKISLNLQGFFVIIATIKLFRKSVLSYFRLLTKLIKLF